MDHKIPPRRTGYPSYVAGSRHNDSCHWFVNGQELDAQSGQTDKGQTPDTETRLKTLARCMSINKHKAMASEYLAEQQAEQSTEKIRKNQKKSEKIRKNQKKSKTHCKTTA